jgi:hypothetical protein
MAATGTINISAESHHKGTNKLPSAKGTLTNNAMAGSQTSQR